MRERFYEWLANHLPRKVAYHCAIRVGVHATSGRYARIEVPALMFMDALKRWDENLEQPTESNTPCLT
jgi:hypothetical protein